MLRFSIRIPSAGWVLFEIPDILTTLPHGWASFINVIFFFSLKAMHFGRKISKRIEQHTANMILDDTKKNAATSVLFMAMTGIPKNETSKISIIAAKI
mmetsp:Transcript_5571/g.10091  ORF Transcript_5571/g.10091 Transcript_5571/m.10091 type:complete len:98 (+) Transcript_5571:377-670(+)